MVEITNCAKGRFLNSRFVVFLVCVLISLAIGAVISASLFANAFFHDIKMKNLRDGLPSTDLSQIRIEGYDLNQHITDYKPGVNLCDVTFENGEVNTRHSRDSNLYTGDSHIVSIDMPYPVVEDSLDGEIGTKAWQEFTIENTPMPDFGNIVEALGKNFTLVEFWRDDFGCFVYIDRENSLELRFSLGYTTSFPVDSYDKICKVDLTRIDNRTTMEFIKELNNLGGHQFEKYYTDTTILELCYLPAVLYKISDVSREHQFLHIGSYFFIPAYFAAWTFPFVWAVHKKRLGWTAAVCVWYLLCYFFGVFIMLMLQ